MKNRKRQQPPAPDHDSIVADWQQHASAHEDRNFDFLHSLKWKEYGFDPDKKAAELHNKVFQIVDCTRCANCCKTATIFLEQEDVDRISAHLGMETEAFIAAYLERDEMEGGFIMRQQPCPLLGADNRCTVYDVRPTGCREYPHTDKEGFMQRIYCHAGNARICPAVFWIVERMRQRARRS